VFHCFNAIIFAVAASFVESQLLDGPKLCIRTTVKDSGSLDFMRIFSQGLRPWVGPKEVTFSMVYGIIVGTYWYFRAL
jgi:hypothetical protein